MMYNQAAYGNCSLLDSTYIPLLVMISKDFKIVGTFFLRFLVVLGCSDLRLEVATSSEALTCFAHLL